MCTNTGTYLDVPFHRYAHGRDLTGLDVQRVADVPAICLDHPAIEPDGAIDIDLSNDAGKAILIRTGHAKYWGSDRYFRDHPHITESVAKALVDADLACVGIDSVNIDSTDGGLRPVHTTLFGADIPIIENLCNLERLPVNGFQFTAVPPKISGARTFCVRAYAALQQLNTSHMIRAIDPTNEVTARRIVEIQRSAYAVEAELIGFTGIPQLDETVEHVRGLAHLNWNGAFKGPLLVGLIAWERTDTGIEIDRLAVDPASRRRGHGRQLVRSVPTDRTVIVSTGAANAPAVGLYASEGFEQTGSVEIAPGVQLARLQRTGSTAHIQATP